MGGTTKRIHTSEQKRKRHQYLIQDNIPENGDPQEGGVQSRVTITETSVRVTMPVASPGMDDCIANDVHTHVSKLLRQHDPRQFKWSLTLSPPNSRVDIYIDRELASKLPVLAPLLHTTDSPPAKAAKKNPTRAGKRNTSAHDAELQDANSLHSFPFNPPASACGLACLLLLLERTAAPAPLFLSRPWGQELTSETAWVRSTRLENFL